MRFLDESKVLFCKLDENAMIPTRENGNIGYDVYCLFNEDYIVIEPYKLAKLHTGIASVMCDRYAMILHERSSVGSKNIALRAGVIDSSYNGEWRVVLTNLNDIPVIIAKSYVTDFELKEKGYKKFIRLSYEHAIVQAILQEDFKVKVEEISKDELIKYETKRGNKGFGSTNKDNGRK